MTKCPVCDAMYLLIDLEHCSFKKLFNRYKICLSNCISVITSEAMSPFVLILSGHILELFF